MILTKTYEIDYAHRLQHHEGKCKNVHGHTAKITVSFEGPVNGHTGMILDFGNFSWLRDIVRELDHTIILCLSDPIRKLLIDYNIKEHSDRINILTLGSVPTAENIISYLALKIRTFIENLEIKDFCLRQISFEETPGNIITSKY